MPKTKVCTKCGKRKPLGEYHAEKARADGKYPACKECACAAARTWYEKNRARGKAAVAAWRASNRERYLAGKRSYNARRRRDPEYRAEESARSAAWYEANRDWCILSSSLNRDIGGR